MKMDKFHILTVFFLLFAVTEIQAQEKTKEVVINFPLGKYYIDENFRNNKSSLAEIASFINEVNRDSTIQIKSVCFIGSASPEGNLQINDRLGRERCAAIKDYVCQRIALPSDIITCVNEQIAYNQLIEMLNQSALTNKSEVIDIIKSTSTNKEKYDDYTLYIIKKIKAIDGGNTWNKMSKTYFSDMRKSCVIFLTTKEDNNRIEEMLTPKADEHPEVSSDTGRIMDEQVTVSNQPQVREAAKTKLYLKTNLLGWAAAITNAAVEVEFSKKLSLNIPVYYSAWNYFKYGIKMRTLAFQPELRYWFTSNARWFAGAHFGLAWYNLSLDTKYRYQDHKGKSPSPGGGISMGYRCPLTKRSDNHWFMEFALGGGAYGVHYDKYVNVKDGELVNTKRDTYIGLDNAGVSISYMFNLKRRK